MRTIKNHVWHNGSFVDGNKALLPIYNRAFRYGDGLFESIHAFGTEPRYLARHLKRLMYGMKILQIIPPDTFTERYLREIIVSLLNKKRIFGSARVRITVYRDSDGLYTPRNNSAGVVVEAEELQQKMYQLNQNGLLLDFYTEIQKPVNKLSLLKSCNSLLYIKAALFRSEKGLDDCIILNEHGRIAETTSSNIFLVRGNKLFTPSLAEGCIPGIMRDVVCDIARETGYEVNNQVAINRTAIDQCDELFITNAISGIRWVVGVGNRRYFNRVSRQLSRQLNMLTFPDQFNAGFSG